jgi:putative ABC transport system permease protein
VAIRVFARGAGHTPIAPRLALRDLARYQARSGAALAAITLALGIAAAVVIVAAAEEKKSAAAGPNLSNRQIRVYTGATEGANFMPIQTPAELARSAARVRELAAGLDDAAAIPLRSAFEVGVPPGIIDRVRVREAELLRRRIDDPESDRWSGRPTFCLDKRRCWVAESRLLVATPALLRYAGVDPAAIDPSTDFLAHPSVPTNVQRIDSRKLFGSPNGEPALAPVSFITLDGLRRRGWRQIPSGWLLESGRPLTSEQIADARELAANAGLTIETRREPTSQAKLSAIATAAGALLALAILAMTVGLIRSETAGDLRTLTAAGATSRIRRTLTAVTAGGLALLGALLGVAGAYVVVAATYLDDLGYLSRIPVLYLVLMIVGIPWAAIAAGWLLAGREPPAIARPAID